MDEFLKGIIKTILERWDELPPWKKDQIRHELLNIFICFVGDGEQRDKKIIGVHLN